MASIAAAILRADIHDGGRWTLGLQLQGRHKSIIAFDNGVPQFSLGLEANCEAHDAASFLKC
jgi:hypothetical protein